MSIQISFRITFKTQEYFKLCGIFSRGIRNSYAISGRLIQIFLLTFQQTQTVFFDDQERTQFTIKTFHPN